MLMRSSQNSGSTEFQSRRKISLPNYAFSGMSGLARTSVFRGIAIIRSSGPQVAFGGSSLMISEVTSRPMMMKSPFSRSKISGQPSRPGVCVPPACGSGPSLRKDMQQYGATAAHCQTTEPLLRKTVPPHLLAEKFDGNGKIASLFLAYRSVRMEAFNLSPQGLSAFPNYTSAPDRELNGKLALLKRICACR